MQSRTLWDGVPGLSGCRAAARQHGTAYGVLVLLIGVALWLRRRQARYEQHLTESISVPIKADQEV